MIDLDLFYNSLMYVALATNLQQNLGICIYLAQQHFKTDCNIAIWIKKYSLAIFYLHLVQT